MKRFKRWLGLDSDWFRDSLSQARKLGMSVINGGKPGMVAWYGLCLEGTPEQMAKLEAWWGRQHIRWFRNQPRGAWDVSDRGDPIPWDEAMANVKASA